MDRQEQLDTKRQYVIDATETRKPPRFYECGICGCWHSLAFNGDCRDDSNRFAADEIDDALGSFNWEAVEMPGVNHVDTPLTTLIRSRPMDLTIHRTGRGGEVLVMPISTRGRAWLKNQFGLFAQYGHRMQVDDSDLRAFEKELMQEGLIFE